MLTATDKNAVQQSPSIQQLRDAIPNHCFERSASTSIGYIIRDCLLVAALFGIASYIPFIDNPVLRFSSWMTYGFVQGLFFTGLWIIAHECGHQALFNSKLVNNTFGFILHSFLLVPYFSWQHTHSKHHRYHNHMEKDTAFVPSRQSKTGAVAWIQQLLHTGEDTPILSLLVLVGHQLFGWPIYLFFNITAGSDSSSSVVKKWSSQSHFDPRASLFHDTQRWSILLTDAGLLATVAGLWLWSTQTSVTQVLLTYGIPYLWVNHWLVTITFLHHTHPSAVHYEAEEWSFKEAAFSTVDRDFGFIGREIMHGIIEYHVVHHLFTKIPFYHAEEATLAIQPLLGNRYLVDRTPIWQALWETFTKLEHVQPHSDNANILVWANTANKRNPSLAIP